MSELAQRYGKGACQCGYFNSHCNYCVACGMQLYSPSAHPGFDIVMVDRQCVYCFKRLCWEHVNRRWKNNVACEECFAQKRQWALVKRDHKKFQKRLKKVHKEFIIVYGQQVHKRWQKLVHEELMAWYYHPDRIQSWKDEITGWAII